jgi:hypothetical protein
MQYIVLNNLYNTHKIFCNEKIFKKIENNTFFEKNIAGESYCEREAQKDLTTESHLPDSHRDCLEFHCYICYVINSVNHSVNHSVNGEALDEVKLRENQWLIF